MGFQCQLIEHMDEESLVQAAIVWITTNAPSIPEPSTPNPVAFMLS
jgi:hypothetical protein